MLSAEARAGKRPHVAGVLAKPMADLAATLLRNESAVATALDLIKPEIVIISSDEIPAKDDAIDKYKKRAIVFSTREHGTLTIRMHDGGKVEIIDRNGHILKTLTDKAAA